MIDPKVKTLLSIVREGSYSRAAQALSLSQPATSYHIRQLEQEYNIKIFYNNPKKLLLTPEGDILVQYARRLENMELNARRALDDYRQNVQHFTVGITPSIGETLIAKVFASYCSLHPKTNISIVTDSMDNLGARLESYEVDFAIVDGSLQLKHCRTQQMDTDNLCAVMAPSNPLSRKKSVSLKELKQERLILRRTDTGTRRLFESSLAGQMENIRNFDVRLEMDNINAIKELVAANLGVTIIANSDCREEVRTGALSALPIEGMPMIREINIIRQEDFEHPEILDDIRTIYEAMRN